MTITVTVPGLPDAYTAPPDIEKAIDEAIAAGEFGSIQEFVTAALEWYLEQRKKRGKHLPRVIHVDPLAGYRLHVEFDDGVSGTVDLAGKLTGPMFEPLKDETFFRQVALDGLSVCWPNGADICPDTLYIELTGEPRSSF